ncbi:MAG TPA: hypothetical protein VIY72_17695, partial [Acidimicrobiales bacterium]
PDLVLAYNPATDAWRRLPGSGLAPRHGAVTVWTGQELVVWGGLNQESTAAYGDGARLDPASGIWRRLPAAPIPARGQAAAVWSDDEVLLWGGVTSISSEGDNVVGQGAAFDPATDSWRALPLSPLRAKSGSAGVWTGRFFLVIGGGAGPAGGQVPVPGPGSAAFDPATGTWTALPDAPAMPPFPPDVAPAASNGADQRVGALGVWTGRSAVVIGGGDGHLQGPRPDGLAWTPAG